MPSAPEPEFWALRGDDAEREAYFLSPILSHLTRRKKRSSWSLTSRFLDCEKYRWARYFCMPDSRETDDVDAVAAFQRNPSSVTSALHKIRRNLFFHLLWDLFQERSRKALGDRRFPELVPSHQQRFSLFRKPAHSIKYWMKIYDEILHNTRDSATYTFFRRRVSLFCFQVAGVEGCGDPRVDVAWLEELGRRETWIRRLRGDLQDARHEVHVLGTPGDDHQHQNLIAQLSSKIQTLEEHIDELQAQKADTAELRRRIDEYNSIRTAVCFRGVLEKLPVALRQKPSSKPNYKQTWDRFLTVAMERAREEPHHPFHELLGHFDGIDEAVDHLGARLYGKLSDEIHDYLLRAPTGPAIQLDADHVDPWDDHEQRLFRALQPTYTKNGERVNWEAEFERFDVRWTGRKFR